MLVIVHQARMKADNPTHLHSITYLHIVIKRNRPSAQTRSLASKTSSKNRAASSRPVVGLKLMKCGGGKQNAYHSSLRAPSALILRANFRRIEGFTGVTGKL